ncbi:MAG: Na/Pi cotransporter family protein [Deltaproteobacteria bacterium]|nr:Na/Pi cotransporter family protein [Deltaproteobacteria bacterium]
MNHSIVFGILGGLGIFIYGIYLLSDSLQKLSLGLLKTVLTKITINRITSMLVGAGFTSLIQSSSATSVLLIGFINAGLISLAAALPVIFGANIGTTVTAQLIAFKLTDSALLFVFAGSLIFFFARKTKHKNKGLAILGFGMLFTGLNIMTEAVKPLTGNEDIVNLFLQFGKYPLLGIVTGLIMTMILQSSSTSIGMVIALASADLLDLNASVYLILGDNIGTCITAVIASIGGKLASRRLAAGHAMFNILGTVVALAMLPLSFKLIAMLSGDISRQIANFHSLFNIVNVILFLPFVSLFLKALNKLIPGEDYEKKETKYLDENLLATPELAIRAVIRQLSVMLAINLEMLEKARLCIIHYNHKLKNEISIDEQSVDEMQRDITAYLVEITKGELSDEKRKTVPALIHSVNDLERVGDYCQDISKLAQRLYEDNLAFSQTAQFELTRLFDKTLTLMHFTQKALSNDDHNAASITLVIEKEIDELAVQYRLNHIERLEQGVCVNDSGLVFSDILIYISRMNDHLCNITKGILHIGKR